MNYRHDVYIANGHGDQIHQAHLVSDEEGDTYTVISRGYSYARGCVCAHLLPTAGGQGFDVPEDRIS